jgi:hypothetical protein
MNSFDVSLQEPNSESETKLNQFTKTAASHFANFTPRFHKDSINVNRRIWRLSCGLVSCIGRNAILR